MDYKQHTFLSKATPVLFGVLLGMFFSSTLLADTPVSSCNEGVEVVSLSKVDWPKVKADSQQTSSCWVSLADTTQWASDTIIWLDVRTSRHKQLQPLDHVMEIPFSSLPDFPLFASRPVVIVGDGFDVPEIERACQQMRSKNVGSIYALKGGSRVLLSKQNKTIHQQKLNDASLSTQEFVLASRLANWKIISINLNSEEIERLPKAPESSWQIDEDNVTLLVLSINSLINTDPSNEIIIMTPDEDNNQKIQSLLRRHGFKHNLFWLTGGMAVYQENIKLQHKILLNKGRSLRQPCGGSHVEKQE